MRYNIIRSCSLAVHLKIYLTLKYYKFIFENCFQNNIRFSKSYCFDLTWRQRFTKLISFLNEMKEMPFQWITFLLILSNMYIILKLKNHSISVSYHLINFSIAFRKWNKLLDIFQWKELLKSRKKLWNSFVYKRYRKIKELIMSH